MLVPICSHKATIAMDRAELHLLVSASICVSLVQMALQCAFGKSYGVHTASQLWDQGLSHGRGWKLCAVSISTETILEDMEPVHNVFL